MAEKSNKRRNSNKNKQIKGGGFVGIQLGAYSTKYFGKAVFDKENRFLGKFIKFKRGDDDKDVRDDRYNSDFRDKRSEEDLKKSVQGYLTYLPAGLPDKQENYITRKSQSMVHFIQKFLVKSLIGLGKTSPDIRNPDNLVDYDEYIKKPRTLMKIETDDDDNFGVERVIDDLDENAEEPLAQVGGKTKRRKHKRRNNKSKRTRRQ